MEQRGEMSKAYVEIDFFQMETQNSASSKPSFPERAPSSFRGIQSVVSRINPQLLRTVMAAGSARLEKSSDNFAAWARSSIPPSPSRETSPSPLPVFSPGSRCSVCPATDTAPLTIFYNGTVTTFDVPRNKAEAIMRADGGNGACRKYGGEVGGRLARCGWQATKRRPANGKEEVSPVVLEETQRKALVVVPLPQEGHHSSSLLSAEN